MLCGCTFMSLSIKKTKAPSFYTPKIEESDDIFFEQKKHKMHTPFPISVQPFDVGSNWLQHSIQVTHFLNIWHLIN